VRAIDTFPRPGRIVVTGRVPREDLPLLYSLAEVFVFPSLHEGFGLPVLEAMACGTPVVTSNLSSLPEVAGGAALLVDPTSVPDLAAAINEVVTDAEMANDLRERGLIRSARFTWEATARAVVTVIESIGGGGPGQANRG
jgi:glycosyltransferase involved in cell wall biosynthesis